VIPEWPGVRGTTSSELVPLPKPMAASNQQATNRHGTPPAFDEVRWVVVQIRRSLEDDAAGGDDDDNGIPVSVFNVPKPLQVHKPADDHDAAEGDAHGVGHDDGYDIEKQAEDGDGAEEQKPAAGCENVEMLVAALWGIVSRGSRPGRCATWRSRSRSRSRRRGRC
jgi:hypothetical protein